MSRGATTICRVRLGISLLGNTRCEVRNFVELLVEVHVQGRPGHWDTRLVGNGLGSRLQAVCTHLWKHGGPGAGGRRGVAARPNKKLTCM